MKKITILGSTGSIGQQTLEVVEELHGQFEVLALTANSSIELLAEQINKFKPKYAVLMNDSLVNELKYKLSYNETQILTGLEGLIKVATLNEIDLLVNAVVGAIGVKPTLAAIRAGKDIALANKETLVTAGAIVMREAKDNDVKILPIDSEHNAIFQALQGEDRKAVKKIILTASGGPFRTIAADKLAEVTVAEALNHPNWNMGGKITIDSATLMNKGLEVIEAKWLFDLDYEQIDVVVHPQSIIHSLVEYKDHSILAELGLPDMKVPIQYALTYPSRNTNNLESLNLAKVGALTFEEPRKDLFPCLEYAYEAGRRGGTMPAVLNAANEIAVSKFLEGKIKFIDIPKLIKKVMSAHTVVDNPTLDQIIEADTWARLEAQKEGEKVC
ncbi:1-deoxy-D-xylulose-5-phosphate reductoisomerase [Orenia metallireducens]|jgi:1-deoxy-D-xylulose-5-phosphate reductoisomerase|uniref:1-deoxy-D-xylulose 5-phosphate reductoisomerase n=1 Tax=Orenia metallireducens TaxID=1413210 RepID=A0A1C0AA38_9FIRM|nr:1-deoxy-D-xylulose-5-phosphate reductoisomerase [Orenia metallireducens]OCL27123.1 1-deoxy-D-xylulose-5-phosphate reductoisomerase [Orenia metallireducens]